MKHIKEFIALSVLGLALAGNNTTYGAERPETPITPETLVPPTDPVERATPATPATLTNPTDPAAPAIPATPADPIIPTKPETPVQPETSGKPDTLVKPQPPTRPDRSQIPDRAAKPEIPIEVKRAIEEAKAQRTEYLQNRAELLKSLHAADAPGRDQIRMKLKENREQFLALQRENRADFRKNVQELKDKLADHGELLDQAKEQSKDHGKARGE